MQRSHVLTFGALVGLLIIAAVLTYVIRIWPDGESNSDANKTLATTESQVFTDLEGKPFSFDAFEGKIRVVNTWASWTPFSAQELQALESLAKTYQHEPIVFVAVNRKESKEIAKSYLTTLGDFSALQFAIDQNDTYYASVGGYAMPETVIYDMSGTIIFHKRGPITAKELEEQIQQALNGESTPN